MKISENVRFIMEMIGEPAEDYTEDIEIVSDAEYRKLDKNEMLERESMVSGGTMRDNLSTAVYETIEREVYAKHPHWEDSEEETMTHEADRICEEIVSGEYMQYQQVEDRIKNVVETVCCGFDEILNFSELCEAVEETTNFEEWFIREVLKNRKMKAETFFPVWMHDELKQKYSEFLFEWIYERFGFARFGVSYNKNYHDKKPKIEDCNVSIYQY